MQSNTWTLSFFGLDANNTLGMTPIDAVEGYYMAKILNVAQSDVNRPDMIYFDCVIAEGEYEGAKISKGIKLPERATIEINGNNKQLGKTKNEFVWTSLFRALGYQTNQIGQPTFAVNPNEWVGRLVPVFWRPSNVDLNIYSSLLFLEKHVWEQRKTVFERENEKKSEVRESIVSTEVPQFQKLEVPQVQQVQQVPQMQQFQQVPQQVPQQVNYQQPVQQAQQPVQQLAGFSSGGGVNQNVVNSDGGFNSQSLLSSLNAIHSK